MPRPPFIQRTINHVKNTLKDDCTGHDWWHVARVRKTALQIAKKEPAADPLIVELAALLHDIADWKFHGGDETAGPNMAQAWLEREHVPPSTTTHVCQIIKNISFKGAHVASKINTLEGMIVQDADRLDAIGAIGIARAFAYGGFRNREIYNPNKPHQLHHDANAYKTNESPSINHFHEKLLLLKDKMNTTHGKKIAEERHRFMQAYLDTFLREWHS